MNNIQIKDGNDVLTTIATEDISGVEYQLIKIGYGTSGDFSTISSASGLPVNTNLIQPLTLEQFQGTTQSISGTVSAVLLNPEIEISAVSINNFPNIQEISGTVSAYLINNSPESSSVFVANFPGTVSAYILNQTPEISSVNVLNFPSTNGVSGTVSAYLVNPTQSISSVSVTNFPSVQGISGTVSTGLSQGLTNTELRSSLVGVSGNTSATITNFPGNQTVSGLVSAFLTNPTQSISSVSVTNFPGTTSAYILNQTPGTSSVNILNFPSIQEVSGNTSATIMNFPENQTVSGLVSAYLVNQTDVIFPNIQEVSGTTSATITNFPIIQDVNVVTSSGIPTLSEGTLLNYWPAQQNIVNEIVGINVDPSGALQIRGAITSDEGSYSTDFTGSTIYTPLSGTVYFQNGSTTLSGNDTKFLTQLSYGDFVKLSVDGISAYMRVISINTDVDVTLESGYIGSTDTGVGYFAGFEQIVENDSTLNVTQSKLVLNSGLTSASLVQVSRVVDFLPTAAVLRGFSFSQNIPQVDPFFGFFDGDDVRNSQIACFVNFTTYQSAQLITRTSLSTYDTNIVAFTLPGNATVDIPARWRLEVTDDKVSVFYNDNLVATSYNHLPPIYKSLNFNIGIFNVSVPGNATLLYCDELLFKNVDVVNTASSLQTNVQMSYDSAANAMLNELTSVMNSLQSTLKSFASIMGLAVDINGRQRTNVEIGTLTTVGTVTTCSTVTAVTTVGTVTGQTNVGGYAANDMVPANINNSALCIRQSGIVVS